MLQIHGETWRQFKQKAEGHVLIASFIILETVKRANCSANTDS